MAAELVRAEVGETGRLNYKYEAIIDFMLAHPQMKRGEIAEALGYTQAWFSSLTHSDAFVARYSQRRAELEEELMDRHVARLHSLADKSAERLEEALEPKEDQPIDPRFALDVHSRVLQNLGFGPKGTNGGSGTNGERVQLNVQINQGVDQNRLATARQRLVDVSQKELSAESAEAPGSEDGAQEARQISKG